MIVLKYKYAINIICNIEVHPDLTHFYCILNKNYHLKTIFNKLNLLLSISQESQKYFTTSNQMLVLQR